MYASFDDSQKETQVLREIYAHYRNVCKDKGYWRTSFACWIEQASFNPKLNVERTPVEWVTGVIQTAFNVTQGYNDLMTEIMRKEISMSHDVYLPSILEYRTLCPENKLITLLLLESGAVLP